MKRWKNWSKFCSSEAKAGHSGIDERNKDKDNTSNCHDTADISQGTVYASRQRRQSSDGKLDILENFGNLWLVPWKILEVQKYGQQDRARNFRCISRNVVVIAFVKVSFLALFFVVVWPSNRLSFRQKIRPFSLSGIWFRNDLCRCRCWYGRWCCWSVDTSFLNCAANPAPVLSGHKFQSCLRHRVAKTNFKFDSEAAHRLKLGRTIKYRTKFLPVTGMIQGKNFDWLQIRFDYCLAIWLQITSIKKFMRKKITISCAKHLD